MTRAREGDTAALQDAIGAIASNRAAAPAPAPSDETMRLLETDASEFDTELLEIYLTEAGEVLDTVADSSARLHARADDREALVTVRRGFHTLKGSGRMVGLSDLGELAYEVEKLHNRLIEEDLPVTPAVLELIDVSQTSFRGWVDALRVDGRVAVDAAALRAAVARANAELPSHEPQPPPPAIAPIPAPPAAEEQTPDPFVVAAPLIEVLELDESSTSEAEAASNDDLIESPDVSTIIEFVPRPTAAQEAISQEPEFVDATAPPAPLPAEPDETTVGGVTLSTALYRILCDEAQQHLATLDAELQTLQFDPAATPSQAMVRASHTLCGIHRTGGFPMLAATAKALEQCLLGLQARGAPLPGTSLPVLARAIAGLTMLAARVKAREAFVAGDEIEAAEIVAELDSLRQEATTEPVLDDSETIAERVAEAEEMAQDAAPHGLHLASPKLVETVAPPSVEQSPAPPLVEQSPVPVPFVQSSGPVAVVEPPAPPRVAPVSVPRPVPAIAVTPPADETLLGVSDDVDKQVLPIFLDEAGELFPQASEQLRMWRKKPGDVQHVRGLKRTLHTFKGSARMAGAMRLGELTHLMESRLPENDAHARPSPALLDTLDNDLDHIAFVLDRLHKGEVNTALPWLEATAMPPVFEPAAASSDGAGLKSPTVATLPIVPAVATLPIVPAQAVAAAPVSSEGEGARAQLRVRADLIDRLVNEAGEVAIARARVEGELRSLKVNLLELTGSVIRLRSQVREIEIQADSQIQSRLSMVNEDAEGFDPLEFDRFTRFQELTRGIAEGVNDVSTVQQSLLKNLDEADAALLAQARLSRDVQQQLFSIRTVPFGSLSERLYRILRQTAKELDKRANLEIRGTQVELDRSVLEKLVAPLEHLLRNALDHGVEGREARRKSSKPETGEITLTVRQQNNEIAIEIADDGAGLDLERIADRARALGLLAPDVDPTEARLTECIFSPGFSTAATVTQISGRGVGMDVVRSDIAALGGRVEVATAAGKGTTFTLFLPLTLAVAQTVLVRAGGRLWALPAPMVEQVQQIRDKDLINLYLSREVVWQERKYPFFYLPRLLGDPGNNPETTRYNSVVLLKSGQNVTAVHVDEMIGNQEVVVKNIGPQLARVSGIAGATVLGNGEVVLIINPVQLAQRMDVAAEAPTMVRSPQAAKDAAAAAAAAGPPLVMVVDDSLTVRKITSRLLVREGFDIVTAKDGLDALQLIGERIPDVILLDIEMPRMDGFEFAKTIKADTQLAHIPIIMITSRTAEKHRNRARELGVDVYLGKPYQEEELLRHLRELVAVDA